MKTPDEMMAFFRSMPKKQKANPHWTYKGEPDNITAIVSAEGGIPLKLERCAPTLKRVRELFRRYWEAFHSEAQVLCVTISDGEKLADLGIPVLGRGNIGLKDVMIMVLPQDNHAGTSVLSESFWQERIVNAGIVPVARIHSHHILDPYQSGTDYATLNSGTLEMVIGKIKNEELNVCYWLDVPGTDIKAQTFLAKEDLEAGTFTVLQHNFHGQNILQKVIEDSYPKMIKLDVFKETAPKECAQTTTEYR